MRLRKIISTFMTAVISMPLLHNVSLYNSFDAIMISSQAATDEPFSVTDITVDDLEAIDYFLLGKEYNGYGEVKDIDGDGVVNVFDLCLARRYVSEKMAKESAQSGLLELKTGKVTNEMEALEYIDSVAADLAINNTAENLFFLESIQENNNNKYYTMRQKYNDIDVYGGSVVLAVDDQGICNTVIDSFIPGLSVDTSLDCGKEAAVDSIRAIGRYSEINSVISCGKVIYPLDENYYYTYQFLVNGTLSDNDKFSGDMVFVNANDAEVLDIVSQTLEDSVPQTSTTLTDKAGNPLKYTIWRNESNNNLELYDPNNGLELFDINNNKLTYFFVDRNEKSISGDDASAVYNIKLTSSGFLAPKNIDESNTNYDRYKTIMEYFEKSYDYYYGLGKVGMRSSGNPHAAKIKDGIIVVLNDKGVDNGLTRGGLSLASDLTLISFNKSYTENMQLDIAAHEYTHAVLFSEGKLLLGKASLDGALQEAYADIMGEVIERDTSWVHGSGSSDRSAVEDRAYLDSEWIDSDSDVAAHKNSNVIFHCAYLMYEHLINDYGYTSDEAFDEIGKLWYDSVFYLKEKGNGFRDCLNAVYHAGKDHGYSSSKLAMLIDCFRQCNIIDDQNVTFKAVDEYGNNLSDCVFIIDGVKSRISLNGQCSCTLRSGTHYVTVRSPFYGKASRYFTVEKNNTEVVLSVLPDEKYKASPQTDVSVDVDFLKFPLDVQEAVAYYDGTKRYEMNGRIYSQGIVFKGYGNNPDYAKDSEITYNVENVDTITGTWGHVDNTHMKDATVSIYLDNALVDTIKLTSEMELKKYSLNTSKASRLKIHLDLAGGSAYAFGDVSINKISPSVPQVIPSYSTPEDFIGDGYCQHDLTIYNENKNYEMNGRIYSQGIVFAGYGNNPDYAKDSEITYNVENVDTITGTWGHVDNTHMKDATVSIYLDNALVDTISLTSEMELKKYTLNTSKASRLKIHLDLAGGSAYAFGDVSINKISPSVPQVIPSYSTPEDFIGDGYCQHDLTIYNENKNYEMNGRIYSQGIVFAGYGNNPDYAKDSEITYNVENVDTITGTWGHVDNTHMKDATVSIYLDNALVDTISLTSEMELKKYTLNTSKASRLKIHLDLAGGSAYAFGDVSVNGVSPANPYAVTG